MKEFLIRQDPVLVAVAVLLWAIIGCVIENAIVEPITNESLIFTPSDFYKNTNMNWFGSWFCFILLAVINPFGFLIKLIVYLVICIVYLSKVIEWLFTVGRKEEQEEIDDEDE